MIGMSMFATAVDSGDYVAVAGGAYTYGIAFITDWWLGITCAWLLAAFFVFLPMYRTGMYTNAEYLEFRFGPTVRVLSVLIQIQYRTNVLGNIAYSLYLTFRIVTDWTPLGASVLVGLVAFGAALYTASGGLRSVAVTDAIQSVFMIIASLVLWVTVWNAVGGWSGMEARLNAETPGLADSMLHVGGYSEPGVPATLVVLGWIILLSAYCMVNHSQSMRMMAARSEWDMKMAALVASVITVVVAWFNVSIGIMGRAMMPGLGGESGPGVDVIFPQLVSQYIGAGLLGLVVAGLLAGGISTYDSIGSALSALFTRDIYARFLVKDRDDRHYLTVSRVATFVMIAISFAYVPFLQDGMLKFYLGLVRVTVIPLFTVTMLGTLTRVGRESGAVGLAVGILYGLSSFLGDQLNWSLPVWWINVWWSYLWSIVFTGSAMVITSVIRGWATPAQLGDLVYRSRSLPDDAGTHAPPREEPAATTWLERTRREVPRMPVYPFPVRDQGLPWYKNATLWAWLFVVVIAFINLIILW